MHDGQSVPLRKHQSTERTLNMKPRPIPATTATGEPYIEAAFPGDEGESPLANPNCPWYGWFKKKSVRAEWQNEAEFKVQLVYDRHNDGVCGAKLYLFQLLCTHWKDHETCKLKICKRKRACSGRRDPNDWSRRLLPVIPPCVPLDDEVIEKYRKEILAGLKYNVAKYEREGRSS
jgi:hypothetical protein